MIADNMLGFYMKNHLLFNGIDDYHTKKLNEVTKQFVLKKNQKIFITNSELSMVYLLAKGKLKVACKFDSNNLLVKDILYPGELFGNITLNGAKSEGYVEALINNTIVYCFSAKDFRQILQSSHKMTLNYVEIVGKRLSLLNEKYDIWTRQDTKEKFIFLLRKWAREEGKPHGEYVLLNTYLSLSDIADILSVSRQFMHKLLKELIEEGILKYNKKQIEINKNILQEIKFVNHSTIDGTSIHSPVSL